MAPGCFGERGCSVCDIVSARPSPGKDLLKDFSTGSADPHLAVITRETPALVNRRSHGHLWRIKRNVIHHNAAAFKGNRCPLTVVDRDPGIRDIDGRAGESFQ